MPGRQLAEVAGKKQHSSGNVLCLQRFPDSLLAQGDIDDFVAFAAENFSQHAEHYARMRGEAMKEHEAKRLAHEAQQQAQREQQQKRDQNRDQNQNRDQGQNQNRDQNNEQPRARNEDAKPEAAADTMSPAALAAAAEARAGEGAQPDVIDLSENGDTADSGLVETVEAAPKPARKPRTRKPKAKPTEEAAASKDETPAAE